MCKANHLYHAVCSSPRLKVYYNLKIIKAGGYYCPSWLLGAGEHLLAFY